MWLIHLLLGLAVIYIVIVSAAYFAQTWLLFPTKLAEAGRPQLPAAAERLEVKASDGERLVGVRIPAASHASRRGPLLLGFGGNAWNAENTALYLHDVLQQIVAVGFSIGTGVAAYLARHRPLAGLILVTPFDSLEALAREHYFWAPVGLLLRHRMATLDWVGDVRAPTALITARYDTIVPERRSAPLRRAIPNLVFDRTIEAGHNDLYDHPAFVAALREAHGRIAAAAAGASGRAGGAEP